MEAGIFRLVDDAHSAATELLKDAVMGDGLADGKLGFRHGGAILDGAERQVNAAKAQQKRSKNVPLVGPTPIRSTTGHGLHLRLSRHQPPRRERPSLFVKTPVQESASVYQDLGRGRRFFGNHCLVSRSLDYSFGPHQITLRSSLPEHGATARVVARPEL